MGNHTNMSHPKIQHQSLSQAQPFTLIESFPIDGKPIRTDEVKSIYLKFNNPVDKETLQYIGNLYIQVNSFCQWNICGWIQLAEEDTKLIWHVNEDDLKDDRRYGPLEIDYQRFEIHIGRPPEDWRVHDIYGNKLPRTIIRVFIRGASLPQKSLDKEHLEVQIAGLKRRLIEQTKNLNKLLERAAKYGDLINAPLDLQNDVEKIETHIAELKEKLAELEQDS